MSGEARFLNVCTGLADAGTPFRLRLVRLPGRRVVETWEGLDVQGVVGAAADAQAIADQQGGAYRMEAVLVGKTNAVKGGSYVLRGAPSSDHDLPFHERGWMFAAQAMERQQEGIDRVWDLFMGVMDQREALHTRSAQDRLMDLAEAGVGKMMHTLSEGSDPMAVLTRYAQQATTPAEVDQLLTTGMEVLLTRKAALLAAAQQPAAPAASGEAPQPADAPPEDDGPSGAPD